MILSELHPDDYKLLKQEFAHDKQVAVHHLDGYLTLKAFLPPQENRGLVLIDPSYEKTDEFQQIIAGLQIALERWRGGTYVIWYPIKTRELVKNFINSIKQLQQKFKIETILNPELEYFANEIPEQLNGCGMLIINPPWKSAQEIIAIKNLLQQKSINDKLD
jgi:23S rRNA (adenine2030-N6)-methyltransferase